MPISFQNQIFHLQTRAFSYAMQVLPSGHLAHLYWGAPLREANLSHLLSGVSDRAFSPNLAPDFPRLSLDTLPQEAPGYGTSDFRSPLLQIKTAGGHNALELLYQSHRIFAGKPVLDGLPATYTETDDEAQTLEIELLDANSGALVTLSYSVFESLGALTRSVKLENRGPDSLQIERIFSASVDFNAADFDFLQLSGAWARERDVFRTRLRPGTQSVESWRGASSHQNNPFFAILERDANETAGQVWSFNLVYSGNFYSGVEVDQFGTARAQTGLNSFGFGWNLAPGESFQAPEAILIYSSNGLGEISRISHELLRTRLCRGTWRDKTRPILVNSWEASYFDINEEKILRLADAAKTAGIELLVMDDGWFGARDDDHTSLGDWHVHATKFPDGLAPLARKINEMGLAFGLWFEPEMISPVSQLYEAHPDWCLHVPNRRRTQARQQLILDFSREDVCDYIVEVVSKILSDVPISYVKWDMNRHMTEIGSAILPPQQQREVPHRYILGLYRVLEQITARFPDVLFESCSGGGGRFDPGLLFYMPQVWTSDNTDAVSRLRIQYGTSLAFPASAMGAHVSDCPNHQVHRNTPFASRGAVAMGGNFGYELDLNAISPAQREAVKKQVAFIKLTRELAQKGAFHRLKSPFEGDETAWMFVSSDQSEAMVFVMNTLAVPNPPLRFLRLRGLDAAQNYTVSPVDLGEESSKNPPETLQLGGDVLMNAGLFVRELGGDFRAHLWHLKSQ